MTTPYLRSIELAAKDHGVDPVLAEAVVLVESGGNPWAWNPEPRYQWFWNVKTNSPFRALTHAEVTSETPPFDFRCLAGDPDQEWWGQQASWGLMQVMGALARELGFRGLYLPQLTEVEPNLDLGCKHVAALLEWAGGNVAKALGAYNAGKGGWNSEQGRIYAGKVLRQVDALRTPGA